MKTSERNSFGKRWRHIFIVLIALFIQVSAAAQTTVRGVVLDPEDQPLVGATVTEKGTSNATISDGNGNFSINVSSPTSVLTFSYIGFRDVEKQVSSSMRIVMEEAGGTLDDVVVIGYGTVKKSDATGSLSAIKPDDFNKGIRTNAQDALVGKIAGVNVISTSGAPGSGSSIRIRSGASLSASNDPLIVIDGVPVDNSTIEGGSKVNIIGAINPNDIESFTVLKDASATAIYGSRASNGVIVITTKKGTDKVRMNYTDNFSVSTTTKRLEVLTAEEYKNFVPGVTGVPSNPSFGTSDTDWQDEIYRAAFGQEHNFSISGKALHNAPYRASVGYTNENGIIKTNNYQRFTFSGGIAPTFFNKHLTVDLNLKVSYENNHKVAESVTNNALIYDPTRPVMEGSATGPGLGYFIWENGGAPMAIQTDNPVAQLELQALHNRITRSIGNAAINYRVHHLEDLQFNLNLGYDVLRSRYTERVPDLAGTMYTANMKDGTGLDYSSKQNKRNYLLDLYANYSHTWAEQHAFNAMIGYGWQHFWKKFGDTTLSPEGKELFSPTHSESEYYLLSMYGRVNYTFDDRYMITATLRADASSRFAKGNRWGWFPSVALGWRISQESFLKDQDVLSDLKLRLSFGQTGQQDIINDYPYMATFSVSYPESRYQFGDKWYSTYRPNAYDSDIKWETTTTYNVGIDYGFLGQRIYGSIDYYYRKTKNLLNTISVVSGTNYSSVLTTNIGTMDNQGFEFSINTVPILTKDWRWDIGFNFTWNDSKITKLNVVDSDSNFVLTGYISDTGKQVQVFKVDERPYTFYLCKQAYDENGKPIEGQYIQEDGSISSTETRYATGKSALPKAYLGFNTQLSYKNWDLAISGHGSFGSYVYNYTAADQYVQEVYSDQGYYSNILRSTMETGFQQQQLYSDYWLERGDFFRIDNITIGYTFPRLWNDSSSLRITFGVQNLCTFTGYSGVDPEVYSCDVDGVSYPGIDREVYPRPRSYVLSFNLNF